MPGELWLDTLPVNFELTKAVMPTCILPTTSFGRIPPMHTQHLTHKYPSARPFILLIRTEKNCSRLSRRKSSHVPFLTWLLETVSPINSANTRQSSPSRNLLLFSTCSSLAGIDTSRCESGGCSSGDEACREGRQGECTFRQDQDGKVSFLTLLVENPAYALDEQTANYHLKFKH